MKSLKDDRSGSVRGLVVTALLLIILAYAISVLFPHQWAHIVMLAHQVWYELSKWLGQAWDALKGLLDKYVPH